MLQHPVDVLVHERPERVEVLATEDVDQEAACLVQIGHGEAHMIETAQSGQPHTSLSFASPAPCPSLLWTPNGSNS